MSLKEKLYETLFEAHTWQGQLRLGSIPFGDSDISLPHARVMLINSSFTIKVVTQNFCASSKSFKRYM